MCQYRAGGKNYNTFFIFGFYLPHYITFFGSQKIIYFCITCFGLCRIFLHCAIRLLSLSCVKLCVVNHAYPTTKMSTIILAKHGRRRSVKVRRRPRPWHVQDRFSMTRVTDHCPELTKKQLRTMIGCCLCSFSLLSSLSIFFLFSLSLFISSLSSVSVFLSLVLSLSVSVWCCVWCWCCFVFVLVCRGGRGGHSCGCGVVCGVRCAVCGVRCCEV